MIVSPRKTALLQTIAAIQNELWLQKIERFVAELQKAQEDWLLQFVTPIHTTFDIQHAITTQNYQPEQVRQLGGFWQLPEEEPTETLADLLAQLTA